MWVECLLWLRSSSPHSSILCEMGRALSSEYDAICQTKRLPKILCYFLLTDFFLSIFYTKVEKHEKKWKCETCALKTSCFFERSFVLESGVYESDLWLLLSVGPASQPDLSLRGFSIKLSSNHRVFSIKYPHWRQCRTHCSPCPGVMFFRVSVVGLVEDVK